MKVEASLISEEDEGSGEGIVEALKKVVEVSKEVLKWVAGLPLAGEQYWRIPGHSVPRIHICSIYGASRRSQKNCE